MRYNPAMYRWEGNEHAAAEFECIPQNKSPKASPALITNVGAISGAKVVGGMVFDPQRMCWLKIASAPSDGNNITLAPEEEDVLAGLDDLKEKPSRATSVSKEVSIYHNSGAADSSTNLDDKSGAESSDEWPITEEFDVGPEFIKRQRAEEEKWTRKVSKWVRDDRKSIGDEWRWVIRDMVRLDLALDKTQVGQP